MAASGLADWLFHRTLPAWRDRGVDTSAGGFHERLDPARRPVTGSGKRAMVQARQIYVFSHAAVLDRLEGAAAAANQGFEFLLRHYRHPDGGWRTRVARDGTPIDDGRDLYAHAFIIFAMAWGLRATGDQAAARQAAAREMADHTLAFLDDRLAHPAGGFHEGLDAEGKVADGPRRQNPHMHLLEAVLAMYEATSDDAYLDRAAELVALARARFVVDGSLREYFADDLTPAPGDAGRIVEPGHHFEWVWLLHQFARLSGDAGVLALAGDLYGFAVTHGIYAASGGVLDQVSAQGEVLKAGRRLWPQLEALKAHAARATVDGAAAARIAPLAATVLRDHLQGADGAWREHLDALGAPLVDDLPASSLYHVMMAVVELERLGAA